MASTDTPAPLRDLVLELLRDPACPYGGYSDELVDDLRGAPSLRHGTRPADVEAVLGFMGTRLGHPPGLEAVLDDIVESIGGSRSGVIDPWSWPARGWRRLRGIRTPTTDVYEIPVEHAAKKVAIARSDPQGG